MAFNKPTWVSTWATAATSPIHDGVEGTDSGATWIVTEGCVILVACPPFWETVTYINLFPYKETHFFGFIQFPSFIAQLCNLVAHPVGLSLQVGKPSGRFFPFFFKM